MCGISLAFDPSAPADLLGRLARLHAVARHRGPDGEGFLAVSGAAAARRADALDALGRPAAVLGIGFRRLRIMDVSEAAAQPMRSAGGRCWIAFNGEAYNFRELRRELAALGHAFHTQGDTEVVLAAYEQWGEACFERLDGMWALAIADLERRRLVLSRDRFGIKPLHWALAGTTLLVASEARQVLNALDARPSANAPLVGAYLAGSRYPCLDETFFEGVHSLPPATWCALPLDAPAQPPQPRPYWRLADFRCLPNGRPPDYGEARARFEQSLRAAVASHAVADVQVGALLSGGLDSSALVALHASGGGPALPTFSFGLPGAERQLSELPYAEAVARAHGLPNHQVGLDAGWVRAHAPAVIRALEEPPLSLAALAQYRVFQLCRQHGATVVLDGQGADEVLGGYPYHQRTLLADRLRRGRLREAGREMAAIGRREQAGTLRLLQALALPPLRNRLRRPPSWLRPQWARRQGAAIDAARADRGCDPSALNRQLYWDVRWGNVKIVLGYTDRNAMAHSIEARVPYFDRALVELAFTLPDHFKVGAGQRKRVLRDTVRPLLPTQVTERPDRMGFALPVDALMRELQPEARAAVLAAGLLDAPWLEPSAARRLLDDRSPGPGAGHEMWRLQALAIWMQEYGVAVA